MQNKFGTALRYLKSQYQNNPFLNRLSAVLAIDMMVKLSGFILIPIYLRLMSQEEFGLYNYLLSILSTFALVLNFGLYVPLIKFYHDNTDKHLQGRLLFTVFATLLMLMAIIITPMYLFKIDYWMVKILFKNPLKYGSYRMIILLALVITILSYMLTNYFFTSEKIKAIKNYNLSRIIIVNLAVLAWLFLSNGDSVKIRLGTTYLVELVLFCIFVFFILREFVTVFDSSLAFHAIKMGWPIMLSAIMGIIINFSDKFFLEKYGDFKYLSNYYLAASFAGIISLIGLSVQNAWLPSFMKEKDLKTNISMTRKLMKQLFFFFLFVSVGIYFLFFVLLKTEIIPAKYLSVLSILPLLLPTQIFAALTPILGNYLIYFQKTYLVSLSGSIVCLISLAGSLALIPKWGVYGAATASLLSNLSYLLIYFIIVKNITRRYLLLNNSNKSS